jgi:hypothetical protein
MPKIPDQPADGGLAALISRRAELQKIVAVREAAEVELRALDAQIDKAEAPQPDPIMAAALKTIADHHLDKADADAVVRAVRAAQFPALVAQQRDREARAKRAAIDASIADDGEPNEDL